MPCDSRVTIRTTLKNVDLERMVRALAAIGIAAEVRDYLGSKVLTAYHDGARVTLYQGGDLTMDVPRGTDGQELTRRITQAYSAQVIRDAGQRFGFRVQTTKTQDQTIKLTLSR